MTDEKPIEPSAIFAADGSRVPYRGGPKPAETSSAVRPLLPALVRAATSGPLLTTSVLTASVLARTGVAAATAAEAAGWRAWQGAWAAIDASRGQRAVPGGLQITWTRIEIR
jgi:hypothetical protein